MVLALPSARCAGAVAFQVNVARLQNARHCAEANCHAEGGTKCAQKLYLRVQHAGDQPRAAPWELSRLHEACHQPLQRCRAKSASQQADKRLQGHKSQG